MLEGSREYRRDRVRERDRGLEVGGEEAEGHGRGHHHRRRALGFRRGQGDRARGGRARRGGRRAHQHAAVERGEPARRSPGRTVSRPSSTAEESSHREHFIQQSVRFKTSNAKPLHDML